MMIYLYAYLSSTILFFGLDMAWLSLAFKFIYKPRLGSLLLDKPNLLPAILFYLLYGVGLTAFVVLPTLSFNNWSRVLYFGMLFGLVAYSTYDLTNLATIRGWSGLVTVLDILWGTIASGIASVATYFILRKILPRT